MTWSVGAARGDDRKSITSQNDGLWPEALVAVMQQFDPLGAEAVIARTSGIGRLRPNCDIRHRQLPLRKAYSITSSARPSNGSGTVRPSAFAARKLMLISTLVDCWTGNSAGFSPLSTRPT